MHLAGHFPLITVDWIVPAFDVDRSAIAMLSENSYQSCPIRFAESGCTMGYEWHSTTNTLVSYNIPLNLCIFPMDMENAIDPLFKLGQGFNKTYHLVARFPFQTQGTARHGVEHHFPRSRAVGNIPITAFPVTMHVTIFKRDTHAFIFGLLCEG